MTVTEIIDEILPGESQDAPVVERAQFRVTDESSACWVLRRLAAIEAEAALVKAQAARRIEELAADRNRLLARFSSELEAWARQEAQRRRRRSVTLMYGTLAFRSVPARLEIADAQAAADVALTLGLVKPASADLAAYRKRAEEALGETGELLPGVALVEARESFSVRVAGGEFSDTRESGAAAEGAMARE